MRYRLAFTWILVLALSGCELLFPSPPPHHAKPAPVQVRYRPEDFLRSLALVQLGSEVTIDKDVIKAYMAQKPEPQVVQALVFTYRAHGVKRLQQVAVAKEGAVQVLNACSCVLHDLHVTTLNVTPGPFDDARARPSAITEMQTLIAGATPMPPLEEAGAQAKLASFFIDNRLRDAAYLSVDNLKQLLAKAARGEGDADTLAAYSQQLDALEERLRAEMPYTLAQ